MIPKGTSVAMHIYNMHRNPKVYPEPDKFNPDRFLPENMQHRHPYAYVPFSAGPRNCVGTSYRLFRKKCTLFDLKIASSILVDGKK